MDQLIQQFKTHLEQEKWSNLIGKQILLACSGGRDSVFLCHAFQQLGLSFGLAHYNFQLRGAESDADEAFVRSLAKQLDVPVFVKRFDTLHEQEKRSGSIQEVARGIRYKWLEKTRKTKGFDFIATAHHLEDNLETQLLNLTQGTGLKGLTGIPERRKQIIRPMLWISRSSIDDYLTRHGLQWREDASNQETKYSRNKIRHQVIPVLREINPGLDQNFQSNLENFQEAQWILNEAMKTYRAKFSRKDEQRTYIDWVNLQDLPARKSILFYLIRRFGFHPKQIDQIWSLLDSAENFTGKIFQAKDYQLLVDRDKLIIEIPEQEQTGKALHLPVKVAVYHLPEGTLRIEEKPYPVEIDPTPNKAFLDKNKLGAQLIWRKWQQGDKFQPLGLSAGRQKVSDFLINQKLDQSAKANVHVLCAQDSIAWLAPYRIADPFKIDSNTKTVLIVTWE